MQITGLPATTTVNASTEFAVENSSTTFKVDAGTMARNLNIIEHPIVVVDCGTISSLPTSITNTRITADMVVINSVLGTPSAQTSDWTVTTSANGLTVSGSISGSTTLILYFARNYA